MSDLDRKYKNFSLLMFLMWGLCSALTGWSFFYSLGHELMVVRGITLALNLFLCIGSFLLFIHLSLKEKLGDGEDPMKD